jgi:hypothetical protein
MLGLRGSREGGSHDITPLPTTLVSGANTGWLGRELINLPDGRRRYSCPLWGQSGPIADMVDRGVSNKAKLRRQKAGCC